MNPLRTLFTRVFPSVAAFALSGALAACDDTEKAPIGAARANPTQQETPTMSYTDISVRDIESYRGKARLVDVREPFEYTGDLGHIAGAELVPLGSVSGAASSWDPNEPIVLICRSGGRSGRAADALVRAGFKNVMNMAGGMMAYNAAGLPVER
jgi:rhodanese-related sulfurtransferase